MARINPLFRLGFLLCALVSPGTLFADEPTKKVDLKTRDAEKPVFVLIYTKTDECKETRKLMDQVAKKYDVRLESYPIEEIDEHSLRYDVLVSISVLQQIQIDQTERTKSLYPHLIIYLAGKPATYYPQARKKKTTVTIDGFLDGLQKGSAPRLDKSPDVLKHLKEKGPPKADK